MIKALEDFVWLYYVQTSQGKAKRVFFIEKIFEDGRKWINWFNLIFKLCLVTFSNASEPRCPPKTYQEIKDYIENVLDPNHIPSITPQYGMLLNNGDKSLFYDEVEEQQGNGDTGGQRGGRGRSRG